ncbi:MAG: hypothetical protein JNM84_06910 [Planctomycetes bacterium]|nr:hypothetical protein [Planctomycetota bacterium]
MNASPLRQALHRATTALFLVAVTLPLALHLVTADDARDILQENRTPAPRPSASSEPASWAALPKAIEDYYRDFVRGRTSLLRTQRRLRWELFGATPVGSETIRGEDDWIFFIGNAALEQHRGRQPWSAAMLAQACDVLERRRAQLADRGVRYLFVVAPDKMSIFPEQLPAWALPLAERTPIDQLIAAAEARGLSDAILDLRPALRAKKGELPIYYARGTHWNSLGAYHGYAAIAQRLLGPAWPPTGRAEEILALPPSAVLPSESSSDSWGELWLLPAQLRHPDVALDLAELGEHRLTRSWWPRVGGTGKNPDHFYIAPRRPGSCLLVFHDSFWDSLVPFFANHFAATAACSTYGYDPLLADALGAQVVLQICVERNLWVPFQKELERESARAWIEEAELAGSYESPKWSTVTIEPSAPGILHLEGARIGTMSATRRARGIYTGTSPLLGELRLAFFHEAGVRHLLVRPLGLHQGFSFLAGRSGSTSSRDLSRWVGAYEAEGLRCDLVGLGDALWAFDEHGSLTHVLSELSLGATGGSAVDPQQRELRWRFLAEETHGARLRLELEAEPEKSVELVRRAHAR